MTLVLFVSRPSQDKGLDVLLDALSQVRSPAWSLEVVGDIIEEHQALVTKAQGRGMPIRCLGRSDTPRVAEIMRKADILVVPSRYENFGNVALEGMASGCMVIASRTGGLPDLVENGVTGWLTKPGDAVDLAIALDLAMAQPDWVQKAKGAAVKKAQRYGWNIIQKDTLDLLNSLITAGSVSKDAQ